MAPNKGEPVLEYAQPLTSAGAEDSPQKRVEAGDVDIVEESAADYNQPIKWHNVVGLSLVHIFAFYSFFYVLPVLKTSSVIFLTVYGLLTALGITAGVHRLWAHRSYKANFPLRVFLMLCYATAGQNKMHTWVRDHRVHHKFSETPADPHNVNRGFFFAHVGWLMKKKHPSCLKNGKTIDMSDIKNDAVIKFHDDNFVLMKTLWCFLLPTMVVRYMFGEPWWIAFLGNMGRYCITLNNTWVINSLAHSFGNHPYDKNISPSENLLAAVLSFGEGWHNYHHTFPWDYRSAEFGMHTYNMPTVFIDFAAKMGWASDLKTASSDLALRQAKKKGDGSRFAQHTSPY